MKLEHENNRSTKKSGVGKKLRMFRNILLFSIPVLLIAVLFLSVIKIDDLVFAYGEAGGIDDYEFRSMFDGKITDVPMNAGQTIEKNEVILKLDSTELEDRIEIMESMVREAEAELSLGESGLALIEIDPLPKEYRHVEFVLEESRGSLEKTGDRFKRSKELMGKGAISRTELEKTEIDYIRDLSSVKKAEEDMRKIGKAMGEKIILKTRNEVNLLKTKLESRRKELRILEKHLSDYTIKAPEAGIITYMPYKPSRYVQKGDLMAKMSNVSKKKFVAYVDEKNIRKIHAGQTARISSRSYNYYKYGYFTGEIIKVGELPEKREGTYFYPVEIVITKEPVNIKLGSTADIMIMTGKERVISYLLGLNR